MEYLTILLAKNDPTGVVECLKGLNPDHLHDILEKVERELAEIRKAKDLLARINEEHRAYHQCRHIYAR
jgi:hypothetical protein